MEKAIETIRKPIVKIITRWVLYGLSALLGQAAFIKTENFEEAVQTIIAAIVTFLLAAIIDRWHHNKDTKQK